MVGLDGYHFKGPHPGQLLTVIGINPNTKIFPICYAIVVVESKDSWFWFLQLLIEILSIKNLEVWAFINDKQKILWTCILYLTLAIFDGLSVILYCPSIYFLFSPSYIWWFK